MTNETRILYVLAHGPNTALAIAKLSGLGRDTGAKTLKSLLTSGLVTRSGGKRGRGVRWELANQAAYWLRASGLGFRPLPLPGNRVRNASPIPGATHLLGETMENEKRILEALTDGPNTAIGLAKATAMGRDAAASTLRHLLAAGLVTRSGGKRGRGVRWELAKQAA